MNRKLFTILIVSVFLIASIGFVSASDDAGDSSHKISVKIKWNGDDQSNRPGSVTVNLMKDGKVVDTATLSASNSWSAKFSVSDDGSYSVSQSGGLSGYSVSTGGSSSSGFVITNTLKETPLGAAENEDTLEEDSTDEVYANASDDEKITEGETNQTGDNSTAENQTDNNQTEDDGNATTGNDDDDTGTDDGKTSDTTTQDSKKTSSKDKPVEVKKTEKKVEKKVVKQEKQKPKNVTKTQLRNTGIPVIILVLVAFAAAFVPFSRKK